MSLVTPVKIQDLQNKLYRSGVLNHAYTLARANEGAPGVDGESLQDIENRGLVEWLDGLRKELPEQPYRAQPVRRPLGIPTIRDRVVQTAAKLILEPIWEAELESNAHGYRPGRSARKTGQGEQLRARLVNYTDDFVILSCGKAHEALSWTRGVLTRIGLALNEHNLRSSTQLLRRRHPVRTARAVDLFANLPIYY